MMKNKIVLLITIIIVILLAPNCSKDDLVLDQDYLTVSDLKCYCRDGKTFIFKPRNEVNQLIELCDSQNVKVKGHINYNEFHKQFSSAEYGLCYFILLDLRNGEGIRVCINADRFCNCEHTTVSHEDSAIINKILNSNETDMCYINGVIMSNLLLTTAQTIDIDIAIKSADDIFFKSDKDY
jgi:hypothetical protein